MIKPLRLARSAEKVIMLTHRALAAANVAVRCNAFQLFVAAFPLQDPDGFQVLTPCAKPLRKLLLASARVCCWYRQQDSHDRQGFQKSNSCVFELF